MFVEQVFQVKYFRAEMQNSPNERVPDPVRVTPLLENELMAMLPSIDVLTAPSSTASRLAPASGLTIGAPLEVRLPVARTRVARPQAAYEDGVAAQRRTATRPNFARRRLGVAVSVILLTILSVVGVGQAGAERTHVPVAEPATVVIVQPGDTLWSIAERVAPNVDRRTAVDQLAEIAGGAYLEVGQHLEVPAISG